MSEPVKEFKDGLDLVFIKDGVIYPVYLDENQQYIFYELIEPLMSRAMGKVAVMGNYVLNAQPNLNIEELKGKQINE